LGKAYTYLRMKFALLLSGLAAVTGQMMGCYSYNSSQCTAANNCTQYNTCSRNSSMAACPTSDPCNVAGCADLTMGVGNMQTCSKCADQCGLQTTASGCTGVAGGACVWSSICISIPPTPPCVTDMSQSACTADAYGCFWVDVSETVCGQSMPFKGCFPCNMTGLSALRGPISRLVGQTCTWPAASPYTQGFSAVVNAFGTGTSGSCTAIASGTPTGDAATLTTVLGGLGYLSASTTGTCAKASSSSMLSPSLAILGLVAFVTRL